MRAMIAASSDSWPRVLFATASRARPRASEDAARRIYELRGEGTTTRTIRHDTAPRKRAIRRSADMDGGRLESGDDFLADTKRQLADRARGNRRDDWRSARLDGDFCQRAG